MITWLPVFFASHHAYQTSCLLISLSILHCCSSILLTGGFLLKKVGVYIEINLYELHLSRDSYFDF